jgi:hypothetical protein
MIRRNFEKTCMRRCAGRRAVFSVVLVASILTTGAANPATGMTEILRTVDALGGHWVLTGTDVEPGKTSSVPAKLTMDCAPTALHRAVTCHMWADLAGDRIEAALLIGYSPDEQLVRWMEIASSGEYHDHRGHWKGDAIQFEPLAYTISGVKMTEYLTISFPSPGSSKWKWTVEAAEGNQVVELTGSKSPHG